MALIKSCLTSASSEVTKLSSVTGTKVSSDVYTFDITSLYNDYANLTIDDIAVQLVSTGVASSGGMTTTFAWTYSNGVITCTTSSPGAHFFGSDPAVVDVFIFV